MPRPRWLRPKIDLWGKPRSAFQVCGIAGLAAGFVLALSLAASAGLSRTVIVALFAAAILAFLTLAMLTKIVAGGEVLIYYHHEIAVLAAAAFLLHALDLPALPYLDLTALGIGAFLAFGRMGCLLVGCCHGRPHRWGVRYGDHHVHEGFPACYASVPLLPVQLIESLLALCLVMSGAYFFWKGSPPGTVLAWYVAVYGAGRFFLERLRGDFARPYWLRLSEAQWTSLLLVCALLIAEWSGRLPYSSAHAVLLVLLLVSAVWMRREPHHDLLDPRHLAELATAIAVPVPRDAEIAVRRTSLGIAVSRGHYEDGKKRVHQYSLSRAGKPLEGLEAALLANQIVRLQRFPVKAMEVVRGGNGVFHLLLLESGEGGQA